MGAGGSRNYAQSALDTLALERLKAQTPIQQTETDDILKRYTEGTGAVPTSQAVTTSQSAGLQGILDKIAAEKEALKDLTVTETSTRMVPQYEMTTLPPGYGLAGAGQPTTKMVTELPKGAELRQGAYGSHIIKLQCKVIRVLVNKIQTQHIGE